MANYTVAIGEISVHEKTLVASTVDTVTFGRDPDRTEVYNDSSTDRIYFTVDGSTPTVAGVNCYVVPPKAARAVPSAGSGNVVKLISTGTPTYSVSDASGSTLSGGGGTLTGDTTPAENMANPTTAAKMASYGLVWDGSTWDRAPGNSTDGASVKLTNTSLTVVGSGSFSTENISHLNTAGSLLSSAARTADTASADQTNLYARGVLILVDFTATPNDAQTMTAQLQAKDPVSGKYLTVSAFTALTASALGAAPTTETYGFLVYPGAAETAVVAKHEVQALALPRTWRVNMDHSAAGSWTYSVGYSYVL